VWRILSPVAAAAAPLYFLIDAIFLSAVRTIIRPLARALSRLRIFNVLAAWLASLGPYSLPDAGAVAGARDHSRRSSRRGIYDRDRALVSVSLIAIGEVLKTVLVERLFHFSRDKLMTIPAFARSTIGRHLIAIKGDGRPLGCLKQQ
jgi:hypothetical protein